MSGDRIRLPAAKSHFASANARFQFSISSADGWRSKQGRGKLTRADAGGETVLWEGLLPQEYGPRYVLVSDHGHVLLLDEWINVKSRYAVMLLSPPDGIVQHTFDDVQAVLDVPAKTIVRMAKGGWWISAPPTLSAHGDIAQIPTAGKVLQVDLRSGALFL